MSANSAEFNLHRWASVLLFEISKTESGRALIDSCINPRLVAAALASVAAKAKHDARGNRLTVSESGSAALHVMRILVSMDPSLRATAFSDFKEDL